MDALKEINREVSDLVERAYNAGFQDGLARAKEQVLAAISGDNVAGVATPNQQDSPVGVAQSPEDDDIQGRKRAPRGLPKALTVRVLKASPDGATPQQIVDAANTEFEKMIAISSIRSELRKGEESGRYLEIGGVWFWAEEAEDQDLQVQPSASDNDERKGGDPYAPAVT